MSVKRKIISLLLAVILTCSCVLGVNGSENESVDSYAGKVKITDVQTQLASVRTTEVTQSDLMLSVPNVNVRSYLFTGLYTTYWEGPQTELIGFTDALYVYPGDVVVTLKSNIDTITLKEKELSYQRKVESHKNQCELYEQQIQNKEDAVTVTEGTSKEIALLELQKLRLDYEEYLYRYQMEITPLKDEIDEMRQNAQATSICADREGYLYIANRRLTMTETPTVNTNEALFSIVTKRDCIYYAQGEYPIGCYDAEKTVQAISNLSQRAQAGVADGNPDTAFLAKGALTDEVLEKVCGTQNISSAKFKPKFSVKVPICTNAVLVPISMVYLESGVPLTEEMSHNGGIVDYNNRYYVCVYENEIAIPRYVSLGQNANNQIAILDGLQSGELIVSQ